MDNIFIRVLRRLFWYFCKLLPVDKEKIIFCSYYGRKYSDNPKYIAEVLNKKYPNWKYVWIIDGETDAEVPENFKVVKMLSFKYIYEMSTSKVWVDNARKLRVYKKKNQYYMQTWHGSFGLKKIEKDAGERLDKPYIAMSQRDGSQCDVLLSNCRTLTKLYRDAFWIKDNCEIIEKGLPRNDKICNYTDEDVIAIKERLGVPDDVKIMLYAPTFRDSHELNVYNMDYKRMCDALSRRFGDKWICILRLHPNIFRLSNDISTDNINVFNASFYPDIQDLYIISDLIVTDYSSVMFDFMILNRPCLLYASDIEEYKKERDFFIPISSLPFPLAQNNDEMEENILSFDENQYFKNADEFYKYHGFCDKGIASQAAAEWIIDKVNN